LLLRAKWSGTNGREQQYNRERVPHFNVPPRRQKIDERWFILTLECVKRSVRSYARLISCLLGYARSFDRAWLLR
jgi:hypothetical protein